MSVGGCRLLECGIRGCGCRRVGVVDVNGPSFYFRRDSGSGVTYLSVNDDERGCRSSSGRHVAVGDVAPGGRSFIP